MKFKDQVVWITGASSGIGEACVYESVKEGAIVIASARREKELQRVKNACGDKAAQVHVLPLDLTQSANFAELAKEVFEQHGKIDVLINNGGISQRSLVHEAPLSVDRKIFEVNFFGQVALTKAVLPYMLEKKHGQIAAISSVVGKFGFPLRSAYAASKHALHGFFETVDLELSDKGVQTTMVCPGRIKTAVSINALTGDGTPANEMDPGQENGMAAEECARQIMKAIHKRKKEVYIGRFEILAIYFKRYMPWLFRIIARKSNPR
ncbi:MAG: SDR family oxidoreductase [Bacteroidota bacterium]